MLFNKFWCIPTFVCMCVFVARSQQKQCKRTPISYKGPRTQRSYSSLILGLQRHEITFISQWFLILFKTCLKLILQFLETYFTDWYLRQPISSLLSSQSSVPSHFQLLRIHLPLLQVKSFAVLHVLWAIDQIRNLVVNRVHYLKPKIV